jgi:hypothetical protein
VRSGVVRRRGHGRAVPRRDGRRVRQRGRLLKLALKAGRRQRVRGSVVLANNLGKLNLGCDQHRQRRRAFGIVADTIAALTATDATGQKLSSPASTTRPPSRRCWRRTRSRSGTSRSGWCERRASPHGRDPVCNAKRRTAGAALSFEADSWQDGARGAPIPLGRHLCMPSTSRPTTRATQVSPLRGAATVVQRFPTFARGRVGGGTDPRRSRRRSRWRRSRNSSIVCRDGPHESSRTTKTDTRRPDVPHSDRSAFAAPTAKATDH